MYQDGNVKAKKRIVLISGVITFAALLCLFYLKGVAPFGTKALTVMDADIQYIDFFSYYYDVLTGQNSIGYTFGKVLGGTNVAVFSYYLASPFNLLILLFGKSNIHTFFDIAVALKLSLASMTFSFFAIRRMNYTPKYDPIIIITALGYGLSQYSLAQSSNIMWLDGVYMLPLILLQISNIVNGKHSWSLPFIVAITIIFNWYSAGIDCVFTACWFTFELLLYSTDKGVPVRYYLTCVKKYVLDMMLGVLMSAALFLPTIVALKKSSRGSLEFKDLFTISFLGDIPSWIQRYAYGAVSEYGRPALFCGGLALILALFVCCNDKVNARKRLAYCGIFTISLFLLYWHPFFSLFSLLKGAYSYHYRYSYVSIFTILFLALMGAEQFTESQSERLIKIALTFSVVQIVIHYLNPEINRNQLYATTIMILLETVCYLFWSFRKTDVSPLLKRGIYSTLLILGVVDVTLNANFLINSYLTGEGEVKQYKEYRSAQEKMLEYIDDLDSSFFRISQTTPRKVGEDKLTAYYNEGLAYNYASISGYTSAPDDNQVEFLNRLGYAMMGENNMNITNTSILGADSLLGVKYILSSTPIQGLEKVQDGGVTGKSIYLNPNAMPIAFTYHSNKLDMNGDDNPFEFQNKLYKQIFSITENLYEPINFSVQLVNEHDTKLLIDPSTNVKWPLYGNLPSMYEADTSVYVNDTYITKYACWLSPSVFYLPRKGEPFCFAEVRSSGENFDWNKAQFYTLNLNVLQKCADMAKAHKIDDISIENGLVVANVNDIKAEEQLFLSIPYDEWWSISVNGEKADTELIGNCLYSIKLNSGDNHIVMKYHVKFLKLGIIISLVTTFGYGIIILKNNVKAES